MIKFKSIATVLVASLGLVSTVPAYSHHNGTFSLPGKYVFEGAVQVQKNLSPAQDCWLTMTIKVSTLGHAKVSSSLGGNPICESLWFDPVKADLVGLPGYVMVPDLQTNIPAIPPFFPIDWCFGNLIAGFDQSVTPREIEFSIPLSNTPAGQPSILPNPCLIWGKVTQVSGPGPLSWAP